MRSKTPWSFLAAAFVLLHLRGTALPQVQELWRVTYDNPVSAKDIPSAIVVDADGNSYVTGYSIGGEYNAWVIGSVTVKYDPSGRELWTARGEGVPLASALAPGGKLIVAGHRWTPAGSNSALVVQYDTSGNELWRKEREGALATALAVDAGGSAVIAGFALAPGEQQFWSARYAPDGELLWDASYVGPLTQGLDDGEYGAANAVATDAAGNAYVTGQSAGPGGDYDFATVKYGPGGKQLWVARRSSPSSESDLARDIAVDPAGNVYVTGNSGNATLTVKYDGEGRELWTSRYEGPEQPQLFCAQALAVGPDGVHVTGLYFVGPSTDVIVTLKYDLDGGLRWAAKEELSGQWGRSAVFWPSQASIALDSAGNVIAAAPTHSDDAASEPGVVKYAPSGERIWVAQHDGASGGDDFALGLAVDDAGSVLVTSASLSAATGSDIATIKLDGAGKVLWSARWDGRGVGQEAAAGLDFDAQGSVVVAGTSTSPAGNEAVTVKYAADGTLTWAARYPGFATGVALDGSGGSHVVGHTRDWPHDLLVLNYTVDGSLAWAATYENEAARGRDQGTAVRVDSLGNTYATGHSDGAGTGLDLVTIKLDPQGNRVWAARYAGPGRLDEYAASMTLDAPGNVYVTGLSFRTLEPSGLIRSDIVTLKYSPSGDPFWSAVYDVGGNEDQPQSIAVDPAGNVYVAGTTADYASPSQMLVVKYRPDGELAWSTRDARLEGAGAIALDIAGNAYAAGYGVAPGTGLPGPAVMKLDPDGGVVWVSSQDGADGVRGFGRSIALDAEGRIYFASQSFFQGGDTEYVVQRYNTDGQALWSFRSPGPAGGFSADPVLRADGASHVYFAGTAWSPPGNQDFALTKLADDLFNVLPGAGVFIRGDSNGDLEVDMSDPVSTLRYLFDGRGEVACLDASDANDDGGVNISDAIATLSWLFLGGRPLPPPNGVPGADPTPDDLRCRQ